MKASLSELSAHTSIITNDGLNLRYFLTYWKGFYMNEPNYPADDGPLSEEYFAWLREYVASNFPPKGELRKVSSFFDLNLVNEENDNE